MSPGPLLNTPKRIGLVHRVLCLLVGRPDPARAEYELRLLDSRRRSDDELIRLCLASGCGGRCDSPCCWVAMLASQPRTPAPALPFMIEEA